MTHIKNMDHSDGINQSQEEETHSIFQLRGFQCMKNIFELDFNDDKKWNSSVVQNRDELINGKSNRSVLTLQKQHWLASQVQQILAGEWIKPVRPTEIMTKILNVWGAAQLRGSTLASHPATPGLNPTVPEILSEEKLPMLLWLINAAILWTVA